MLYREWACYVLLVYEEAAELEEAEREGDGGGHAGTRELEEWKALQERKGGFGRPPSRDVLDKIPFID